MKIQYVSDLHLEFKENSQYLKENPLDIAGEILLIAGDSAYLDTPEFSCHPFWRWASANYKEVVVCLGNHEFYQYYDISKLENHHVPTNLAVADEFKGSQINGAFTCDLSDYIADSGIDYWIYGHSHRNIEVMLGKTKITCNQLGYVFNGEHLNNGYVKSKFIEI